MKAEPLATEASATKSSQVAMRSARSASAPCLRARINERRNLKSQIATSSVEVPAIEGQTPNWSQFVTSSKRHRGTAYRPFAFTEQGAIMAATVLNSPEAVAMSVFVVRAFLQMREQLAANAAILKRLAEIDKTLLSHDHALRAIWIKLQPLLAPPPDPPRRRIGFQEPEP